MLFQVRGYGKRLLEKVEDLDESEHALGRRYSHGRVDNWSGIGSLGVSFGMNLDELFESLAYHRVDSEPSGRDNDPYL